MYSIRSSRLVVWQLNMLSCSSCWILTTADWLVEECHLSKFHGDQFETLLLKSPDDFSNNSTVNSIWLHHNEWPFTLGHDFLGELGEESQKRGNHVHGGEVKTESRGHPPVCQNALWSDDAFRPHFYASRCFWTFPPISPVMPGLYAYTCHSLSYVFGWGT